jgi:hypothetical protein
MSEDLQRIEKRISDRFVDFIDIVFAVVVGTSITTIFAANSFQTWPSAQEIMTLSNLSLLVGYFAVVMSWVGYHKMIELNPYTLNRWGYGRFVLDFLIVFVYTVLIYSRDNYSIFLGMLPLMFLLYACGGIVRMQEYGKGISWPKGSLIYMGLFIGNWLVYSIWNLLAKEIKVIETIPIEWIVLSLTFLYLFLYRWQREKKGFRKKV